MIYIELEMLKKVYFQVSELEQLLSEKGWVKEQLKALELPMVL